MALITDKFGKASIDTNYAIADTVKTTRISGTTVLEANDLSRFNANTPVFFVTYKKTTDPVTAITSVTNLVSWKALVNTGANTLTNLTLAPGYVDTGNDVGDFIECIPTSFWENSLIDGITTHANPDGTLIKQAVKDALGVTTDPTGGWQTQAYTPSTITNNGNHSTDLTFTGVDLTSTLSEGMRLRLTKTVPTQTQCTSLNGTNQYWSKTSPAGFSFTTKFSAVAKVKMSSYSVATSYIVSRRPAGLASGWNFSITPSGQLQVTALNGANFRDTTTNQSIPLNKHTDIAVTVDMTTGTALFYIDNVLVPSGSFTGTGSPTSLVQAGDLLVGAGMGSQFYFPGKISQVAVFSDVISASTIRSYSNQSFTGTETSLISAFTFDGNGNSLGTSNNLTAQNSATATNADSPFGNSGASTDKEYAIVMSKPVYSGGDTTMTVQTPEGCAIPTSGGISSVDYSSASVPFGFPKAEDKWTLKPSWRAGSSAVAIGGSFNPYTGVLFTFPAGKWVSSSNMVVTGTSSGGGSFNSPTEWNTTTPTLTVPRENRQSHRQNSGSGAYLLNQANYVEEFNISTPTLFRLYGAVYGGSGTQEGYLEPNNVNMLKLRNGYL